MISMNEPIVLKNEEMLKLWDLHEKTSQEPWKAMSAGLWAGDGFIAMNHKDAEFIAMAHELIPTLIRAVTFLSVQANLKEVGKNEADRGD